MSIITFNNIQIYRIYLNVSRAYVDALAQINAGVQHSKVNRCLYKMWKGLIQMPGQSSFIGNKCPGFYTDKCGKQALSMVCYQ